MEEKEASAREIGDGEIGFPAPAGAWDRMRMKQWHSELLERMVLNPVKSLKEHAKDLGVHEVTVGQVARSDIFLAKLAEVQGRRERLMVATIDGRMDNAIAEGLRRINEAVGREDCEPGFALAAVEKLDKRRRGDKGEGAPMVSIAIGAGDLAEARKMIQVHAKGEEDSGNSAELLEALS